MSQAADLRKLLSQKCAREPESDVVLLAAIIEVETNWQPKAMRFEPTFTYEIQIEYFADRNAITAQTERCLQRFSFGLGQLMGGTARTLGFEGMLTDLLDPSVNIEYVLSYFNKFCNKYVYTPDKIAAYNAGRVKLLDSGKYINQDYVDKVLAILAKDPSWKAAQAAFPLASRQH